jgi:hypothetical protein
VEAQSSGSLGGKSASWPAIYRVQLRGDQVLRGRSFYDRADVFAQLGREGGDKSASPVDPAAMVAAPEPGDGGIETEEDVSRRYADAWATPDAGLIANFFGTAGAGQAPGTGALAPEALVRHREALFDAGTLRQRCRGYAAGRSCAFLEWELAGTIGGRPVEAVAAERLLLNGPKIAEARIYFDTLAFDAFRDPSVASRTIFDAAPSVAERCA